MLIKDLLINNASEKVKSNTKPYIEIGDINITTKEYTLKEKGSVAGAKYAYKNSILVSTVRPTRGAITIVKEDKIAVSSAFAIIEPNENICNYKYIFYYLNKIDFFEYLGSRSKGATYPTCSKDDIYNYEIDLPSLEIQNKVVKLFDTINESIHIKNKQLFSFDNLIKSQFVEMFKSCNYVNLSEIANINMGQSPSSDSYNDNEDGIPFFQGKADYGDKYTIVRHWTNNPTKLAYKGDVLMSVRAPVGPVNISSCDCCIGRGLCSITSKNGITNNEFIYNALNTIQDELSSKGTGSTFKAITKQDVYNIQIPSAPLELQNKFAKFVEQVDKQKFVVLKKLSYISKI